MRFQTTSEPSGAATMASPIRPRAAPAAETVRSRAAPVTGGGSRGTGRGRLAGQIMAMIVMVVIDAERARGLGSEQAHIFGMLRHCLRDARAADVVIEADDAVALRHDDVQVVRDEQHAETARVAQAADEGV